MVTFKLFELGRRYREPFFLMYGFANVWGGYIMEDWQQRAYDRSPDRQLFYRMGQKLARSVQAGEKLPVGIEIHD